MQRLQRLHSLYVAGRSCNIRNDCNVDTRSQWRVRSGVEGSVRQCLHPVPALSAGAGRISGGCTPASAPGSSTLATCNRGVTERRVSGSTLATYEHTQHCTRIQRRVRVRSVKSWSPAVPLWPLLAQLHAGGRGKAILPTLPLPHFLPSSVGRGKEDHTPSLSLPPVLCGLYLQNYTTEGRAKKYCPLPLFPLFSPDARLDAKLLG